MDEFVESEQRETANFMFRAFLQQSPQLNKTSNSEWGLTTSDNKLHRKARDKDFRTSVALNQEHR